MTSRGSNLDSTWNLNSAAWLPWLCIVSAPKPQNKLCGIWFLFGSVVIAKIEDSCESIPTLIHQTAPHSLFRDFRAINLHNLLVRQLSLSPSSSPCWSSGSQSLKAIPEGHQRSWLQNQWPSAWSNALVLLWRSNRVRLASTSTEHFLVGCSCCWQWLAGFRKKCCQSCYTDLIQEPKRF